MNVSINYTVELDKLPLEVKKLLIEARQTLEGSLLDGFELAEDDFDNENYFRILNSILEIRRQLYNVDMRLQDCHTILADYQKLLLNGKKKEEENVEQLALDLEGSDIVVDEDGNVSLEANENEQG